MYLIIFLMVSSCFALDGDLVVKTKFIDTTFVAHGKLKPWQTSHIASQIGGLVVTRNANVGDVVKKGQILFELDPGTFPLEITQIEIEISKQRLQLLHHQRRYNRRTNNPDAYTEESLELEKLQIDRLKLEIKNLKTKLSMLRLRYSYRKIRSPFDGVIINLFVDIGDWVTLGGRTARIQSINSWKMETELPWHIYSQLEVGDVAQISKTNISQKVYVAAKVPVINPKTDQHHLEFNFTTQDWQPSLYEVVPVKLSVKKRAIQIPLQYVKKELGTYQVKAVYKDGYRWLSVDGNLMDDFFYPNNLDLENKTLKVVE